MEKKEMRQKCIKKLEKHIDDDPEEWEELESIASSPKKSKKETDQQFDWETSSSPICLSENENQTGAQDDCIMLSSESEKGTPLKYKTEDIVCISDTEDNLPRLSWLSNEPSSTTDILEPKLEQPDDDGNEDENLPMISWKSKRKGVSSPKTASDSSSNELFLEPNENTDSDESDNAADEDKKQGNKFRSLDIHTVDILPFDIDGDCAYSLQYDKTKGNRMKSSIDGRNWQRYNKSFTGDFHKSDGLRLKAKCKGSWQCKNQNCPFRLHYGQPNCKHVIQIKGKQKCQECHSEFEFVECHAIKIWEFRQKTDTVEIFHMGKHTCFPYQKPNPPTQELESAFKINPSMRPAVAANKLLMKKVSECNTREEVEQVAFDLSDSRKIRNIKQQVVNSEPVNTKLKELQEKSIDIYDDPFFLFEYQVKEQRNNKWLITYSKVKERSIEKTEFTTTKHDNFETFVVKSSKFRINMMLNAMDKDHFLGDEWVYMDFKMKRVRKKGGDLKTLGLSIYHPLLKRVIWLARMECENESSNTVTKFCNSIDNMLSEHTKGKIRSFRPSSGWMLDEGGALHSALNVRYGKKYCDENVVTCRLHFSQCSTRHIRSAFIGHATQSQHTVDFKALVDKLVHAPTVNVYNACYRQTEEYIQSINKPNLLRWLNWWDSRRSHIIDAYRPSLSCPNTNLAEASHASMELSGGTNLNLAESVIFDISESFKLEQTLKAYGMGVTKSGTGPSKATKDRQIQQRVSDNLESLITELDEQHKGGIAPTQPAESSFKPDGKSSHRADKGPQSDKRPVGRKRIASSTALSSLIQRAKEMLDTELNITINSPTQGHVEMKSGEETYKVTFNQVTECTCPFAEERDFAANTKVPCKHRLYVLMKIGFSDNDDILKQFSYTQQEIRTIIQKLSHHRLELHSFAKTGKYSSLKACKAHVTDNHAYELTFLHGLIKKCYGCEKEFSPVDRKAPYDLVLRHPEVRPRYDAGSKKWYLPQHEETSNAYYHLNKSCVTNIHKTFDGSNIIIPIQLQPNLSEEHRQVIRLCGLVSLE